MEASRKVRRYLFRHVGHLLTAGRAVFNHAERRWRVPVLARTDRGIFPVAEFELDEELNFVAMPSREEILAVLHRQRDHALTLVVETPEEVAERGLTPVTL